MAKKAKPKPATLKSKSLGSLMNPRQALWLLFVLAAGAVGVGLRLGVDRLREEAKNLPQYKLSHGNLIVTPKPEWIAIDFVAKTLSDAGLSLETLSVADRELPARLAQAFGASAWVKSVETSVVVGAVKVELTYRKPVLGVPWQDWACYIAADGVVLPPDPEVDRPALRECLVLGAEGLETPPQIGERFTDPRILAAAQLAKALANVRAELGLLSIVPTSLAHERFTCELRTANGSIIRWGLVDLSSPNFQAKLSRLKSATGSDGKLDHPGEPLFYDLTTAGRTLIGTDLTTARSPK